MKQFKSTRGQLTDFFKESLIWQDVCVEIDSWIMQNHELLEDEKGSMTLAEFKYHSALCRALREVKNISSYMLQDFDEEEI